ncbi:nucleoside phosphorylase [Sulfurospirillum sp. 1612]|uniref:nucleoside phosphorylase n=1 Tax=Sulfurospirillum sp. 1612 TaxID=3094835 RepID=UPI002F92A038
MSKKVLIHSAFECEARALIEYFKLPCIQKKPYKIYANSDIIIAILGMGRKNTQHLHEIFQHYKIQKAINLGIAGCSDTKVPIGSLFCSNHDLGFIKKASLSSHLSAIDDATKVRSMLVDMESDTFLEITQQYLNSNQIYILKVVSDYLDTTIPKKEFVWKIIKKNLNEIVNVVTSQD